MGNGGSTPAGEGGSQPPRESAWASLLKEAGKRLVPLVVSTGSLLTFVAFAGAVIVWTRLNAVEVAPDQAITAFPRGELVAIGASLLLLFGFFGALAVLGAFLIDRGGRPTQGMAYGLLFLLTVEGIAAIEIAAEFGTWAWATAALLFLFPVAIAAWAISLGLFSELRDELHRRPMETLVPIRFWTELRREPAYLRGGERPQGSRLERGTGRTGVEIAGKEGGTARPVRLSCLFAALGTVSAAVAALLPDSVSDLARFLIVAPFAALFLLSMAFAIWRNSAKTRPCREALRRKEEEENEMLAAREGTAAGQGVWLTNREQAKRWAEEGPEAIEEHRLARRRPFRLYLTWPGIAVVASALLLAAWLPALQLGETWLGGALAAAAAICMWLWRVAVFTRDRLIWFGLAVFLSVPLFGTFMNMARNLDDPQIQPIALIRSSDRSDEAIQGLYVTEAKNRVYFATVATEGCTGSLRENSGRLLWVPRDEVVAMSIGPLQSVEEAARTSLEMAFALTPAVETPSGESVSLTSGEARSEEGGLGEAAPLTVQRLENVGPAVRPTFGRGVRLEPEDARPGELVTLRMSTPIKGGFGARRDGRNLRVGGTPARIPINPTVDGERAEYVKTEDGRRLVVDRELVVYTRGEDGGGAFVPAGDGAEPGGRYVKLADDSGIVATSEATDGSGLYLRLERGGGADELATGQTVTYRGGEEATLELGLWRQAWNKDEIKFYVPDKGATGTVTVDCEQLAGQPLLRVERPPQARIAVRAVDSGRKLALDSRRSSDDGRIRARRWALDGLPLPPLKRSGSRNGKAQAGKRAEGAAKGRRNEVRSEAAIGLRRGAHRLRLTVEDRQGELDSASLYVLRIPDVGALWAKRGRERRKRLRSVIATLARGEEAPAEVWIDGYGGGSGKDGEPSSLRAARVTFRGLLTERVADDAGLESAEVPVEIRAFGGDCRIGSGGSAGHRVDVFVAGEGVDLRPPRGCLARRVEPEVWSSEEDVSSAGRTGAKENLAGLFEALAGWLRGGG